MPRLVLHLLASALAMACAFAAIGVALYAAGPYTDAAWLFGAFGAASGLVCGVLDRAWLGLPGTVRSDAAPALAGTATEGAAP